MAAFSLLVAGKGFKTPCPVAPAGLEPAKRVTQEIYSLPPLPLGTRRHIVKVCNQAADGTRTHNILFTREVLCQLSYSGTLNE